MDNKTKVDFRKSAAALWSNWKRVERCWAPMAVRRVNNGVESKICLVFPKREKMSILIISWCYTFYVNIIIVSFFSRLLVCLLTCFFFNRFWNMLWEWKILSISPWYLSLFLLMVLSLDRILDKVKIDDNRVKLLISFLLAREGDLSKRSSRVLKNQPSPPQGIL